MLETLEPAQRKGLGYIEQPKQPESGKDIRGGQVKSASHGTESDHLPDDLVDDYTLAIMPV
jgi:hypothetical protein